MMMQTIVKRKWNSFAIRIKILSLLRSAQTRFGTNQPSIKRASVPFLGAPEEGEGRYHIFVPLSSAHIKMVDYRSTAS
jgi:hypothetical protein